MIKIISEESNTYIYVVYSTTCREDCYNYLIKIGTKELWTMSDGILSSGNLPPQSNHESDHETTVRVRDMGRTEKKGS